MSISRIDPKNWSTVYQSNTSKWVKLVEMTNFGLIETQDFVSETKFFKLKLSWNRSKNIELYLTDWPTLKS